jgi:cellulose synthase/poly-beta-1,6-N-acetylglucosamine synthase-like glycosyltransferase
MDTFYNVVKIIIAVFGVLYAYQSVLFVVGLFGKAKQFPETLEKKKYGVIISARNEEKVIGYLIESIQNQTYDASLIDIFVVADNCSDHTAQIARDLGCHVYERFNPKKARKGYALEFLFEKIEADFGIQSFDAFFFFDADNILKPDFIVEMNKAFAVNKNIVRGFLNAKNFETNVISSAYGIHFYGAATTYHRPRQLLGVGTHLNGTGYMVSSHLIKDGWHCTCLTEDSEFTMEVSAQNIKIGYCEAAVFFDEAPTNFFVAFRQRVRWTRGRLVVFINNWKKLFLGIFKYKSFTNYDMLCYITPHSLVKTFLNVAYALTSMLVGIFLTHSFDLMALLVAFGVYWGWVYLTNLFTGACFVIRERSHINCSFWKTVFYVITFPWFHIIDIFLFVVALFVDVKWTPIEHKDGRKYSELGEKPA